MPSATDIPADGLLPLPCPQAGLPAWCDRFLSPPGQGDFFASRLWYDSVLAHALPAGGTPLLALGGGKDGLLLPLLRGADGTLRSLATPYTLAWMPLAAPDARMRQAGLALGRLLRGGRPACLDTLDAEAPGLEAMLAGLRRAGLVPLRFSHFGNWWQPLRPGAGWEDYLAARPSALRATIRRKLARASRETRFELLREPGTALDQGIAAYEAVRARSWKPWEPFPDFDAALMRAAASAGLLRLGVLRDLGEQPLAAQYWVVSGGCASLLKLAHVEDARAASPGTVLTAWMARRAIEDDKAGALDFGRGDDAYKPLWVDERRQRIGYLLADPRSPFGLAAMARQAAGHGRRQALQWIEKARRRQG
jgi:hypothetical protein